MTYSSDYMTSELFHLLKELYKTRVYFYPNPQQPGLHLNVINPAQIILKHEVGLPEVRKQLLLYLFVSQNEQRTLPETEFLLCQLAVIQYLGKKPCSHLPEV